MELEKSYGWNGLLIEASPSFIRDMKTEISEHDEEYAYRLSLSYRIYLNRHKDVFPEWKIGVGRVNPELIHERTLLNSVAHFYKHFLKALNVETVDFFSLDVEGHELEILKAIPYNLLNIKAIFVENRGHTTEDKSAMKELLLGNGYLLALDTGTDYLFVRKSN